MKVVKLHEWTPKQLLNIQPKNSPKICKNKKARIEGRIQVAHV